MLDKLKYNDTMSYLYLNRRRFLIILNLIYKEVSNVKLSKNIAQKIVLKMMNVIPYNINVMDENGVIIGSGDISRIGNIHEGAKKAIENKFINEVYEEDKMKPGVNEPIIINGNVMGVIGITGNPDEVRKFSKLVCVTANLLIEQAKSNKDIQNEKLNKQKFYNELAYRKMEYDSDFYEMAENYGIVITKKWRVIVVNGNTNSHSFKMLLNKYPHYREINKRIEFFVTSSSVYNSLLDNLRENKDVYKISIGSKEHIAAISLENAMFAWKIGIKIKPSSLIYSYDELKFFIHLLHDDKLELVSFMNNLDNTGGKLELIKTIQVYIEENGDISNIAKKLNIHRNTLSYRLEKIEKLTGKNPKKILDLFELLCGLIWK